MADNLVASTVDGNRTLSSEDITGVHYSRSKIIIGEPSVNDGPISTSNPMPISGIVTANLGATDNAVLDDIASRFAAAITATEGMNNPTTAPVISMLAAWNGTSWDRLRFLSPSDNSPVLEKSLQVTSVGMMYDGDTYDRVRGTSADGLLVNLGTNNDISGTVTANLSATDNAVLDDIATANTSVNNKIQKCDTDTITLTDIYIALKNIFNCLVRPMWANPSTGKLVIDSGTVSTVSTVSTVTGMTNVGGFSAASLAFDSMRNNWAANVRRNIA